MRDTRGQRLEERPFANKGVVVCDDADGENEGEGDEGAEVKEAQDGRATREFLRASRTQRYSA